MYYFSSLQEVMYYGGAAHRPPTAVELVAGKVGCQYEEGNLRYIRIGDAEIIRMIYSAVRDHNWDTIAPVISQEKIINHNNHFTVTYTCRYQQGEIDFLAQYAIQGNADGSVRFTMSGEVLSTFQRNRIGFCVLHPASVAGAACQIEHAGGTKSEGRFPANISPHQPFRNIRQMQWSPADKITASLEFTGDVFEMEDQRNWTDDSFKTYCTPLDLPFPVTVQTGEKIRQEVVLRLEQTFPSIIVDKQPLHFTLSETLIPLPAIGIGQSTEIEDLASRDIDLLKAVPFDHYRIDLQLYNPDWPKKWRRAVAKAGTLKWPLEVALHIDVPEQISEFVEIATAATIDAILIFEQSRKVTSQEILNQVLPKLRQHFPTTKIGSGTDHFFTELNRERLSADNLDFLSYSINPQVHHFDNQSLVETLQAQAYTIASAKQFAKNIPIRVSPITLKMRRNPNATDATSLPASDALPPSVDTRQLSLFGAGWTVGSLRNLIQAGAEAITYFETVGRKGILSKVTASSELFPAQPGAVYSMYLVFRFLLERENCLVLPTTVSNPWQIEVLAFRSGNEFRAILANLQPKAVDVELSKNLFTRMKLLDETSFEVATQQPEEFLATDYKKCHNTISLPPYALVFLTSTETTK
ncbi:hypothetical protein [Tunicatimonas pelagia]|uniref:hypothetical protein n=1 Tax=Tunicatimonas pelagia TaxID=931531 RepID=UPI0026660C84|nr:hypothetical protein [Tunicatimonas pelagia]WKN41132.1 hypothetical protein P0M28_19035 [Tunicatimonas pelagia]